MIEIVSACALAVARFFYLKDAIEDFDWGDSIATGQLTQMEAAIGVMMSCIPSIKILLIRLGVPDAMSKGMSKWKKLVSLSSTKTMSSNSTSNMTERGGISTIERVRRGTGDTDITQIHVQGNRQVCVTVMNGRAMEGDRTGSGDSLGA